MNLDFFNRPPFNKLTDEHVTLTGRVATGHVIGVRVERSEKCWVFPKERFFEWEPDDEASCRFLGIGHDGQKTITELYPQALVTDIAYDEPKRDTISFRLKFKAIGERCEDYI